MPRVFLENHLFSLSTSLNMLFAIGSDAHGAQLEGPEGWCATRLGFGRAAPLNRVRGPGPPNASLENSP